MTDEEGGDEMYQPTKNNLVRPHPLTLALDLHILTIASIRSAK